MNKNPQRLENLSDVASQISAELSFTVYYAEKIPSNPLNTLTPAPSLNLVIVLFNKNIQLYLLLLFIFLSVFDSTMLCLFLSFFSCGQHLFSSHFGISWCYNIRFIISKTTTKVAHVCSQSNQYAGLHSFSKLSLTEINKIKSNSS